MSNFDAKCTKFDFSWGSAPNHDGVFSILLVEFQSPTFKEREEKKKEDRKWQKMKRQGLEEKEKKRGNICYIKVKFRSLRV